MQLKYSVIYKIFQTKTFSDIQNLQFRYTRLNWEFHCDCKSWTHERSKNEITFVTNNFTKNEMQVVQEVGCDSKTVIRWMPMTNEHLNLFSMNIFSYISGLYLYTCYELFINTNFTNHLTYIFESHLTSWTTCRSYMNVLVFIIVARFLSK